MTTLFGDLAGDLTGEPGRTPSLVLLHGLTFDRTSWHPVLAELTVRDPGRPVLALDLPGHGESPPWPGYDLEPIADAVHRAVTGAGLSPPVLAGHSAGGVIATIYAARYPAAGVVNVDQPLQVEPFARLVRSLAGPLRRPGFAQVWEQFEASMGIGLLPQDRQELLRSQLLAEPARWASAIRSMVARSVRVTLIRARSASGEASRLRPASPAARLSSAVSACRSASIRSAAVRPAVRAGSAGAPHPPPPPPARSSPTRVRQPRSANPRRPPPRGPAAARPPAARAPAPPPPPPTYIPAPPTAAQRNPARCRLWSRRTVPLNPYRT
jgi:pimeloyl-ACP methyl ester carboxylesterase